MDFIKEWTMLIAGLVIIAGIVEGLMPQVALKKHVNLAMGFLLMIVLIKPLAGINPEQIFKNDFEFEINQGVIEVNRREQLENATRDNIEKDIAQRLKKYGDIEAKVEIGVDDDNLLSVASIRISGASEKSRKEIANELIKNYECNEIGFD